MDAQLEAELENARQSLFDTYNIALTYGDADTQEEQRFLGLVARMCDIKNDAIRHAAALEVAKDSRTLAEFEEKYRIALVEQDQPFHPKKTADYKNFNASLARMHEEYSTNANDASTSDDMMIEEQICIKDPLTKLTMQNPVKNRKCGHHYEKSSIMNHINGGGQRCPVVGCANKSYITSADLVDDPLFKIHLQNIIEDQN
uniref:E3 SUMO-protein ligase NSE2 n=1 Tax=Glossina palpalis gambiensis TaxID=67801 RepID=A0A1B0BRN3_9MUSC